MQYQLPTVFARREHHHALGKTSASKLFAASSSTVCSLDTSEGTQCLPLYRYTPEGERVDNITDWALEQFQARYPAAARISQARHLPLRLCRAARPGLSREV